MQDEHVADTRRISVWLTGDLHPIDDARHIPRFVVSEPRSTRTSSCVERPGDEGSALASLIMVGTEEGCVGREKGAGAIEAMNLLQPYADLRTQSGGKKARPAGDNSEGWALRKRSTRTAGRSAPPSRHERPLIAGCQARSMPALTAPLRRSLKGSPSARHAADAPPTRTRPCP